MSNKRVFSGVQPIGKLHIGTYLGALSVWAENQQNYDNMFCIVDLHALTIPEAINVADFGRKIKETACIYLACGIDPGKSSIFIQSNVPEHTELAWILNCITPLGWLERMTQYKMKSKQSESIGTGLLDYPVLQAADILLYDTNVVPVGEDQRQHIELTRDIAQRFNNLFGETFSLPEALIRKEGARIMGLDDPEVKMSKILGEIREGHSIGILDTPEVIKRAVMRAVTDSGNEVRFDKALPGVVNLLAIYEVFTKRPRKDIEEHFEGKGYGFLKREVADAVIEGLAPVREKYDYITKDPDYVDKVLEQGAYKAKSIASATLKKVKLALGI